MPVSTAFESRFLAVNGFDHPRPNSVLTNDGVKTDLHAHFAGCPRAHDLVALAKQHHVIYPKQLLQQVLSAQCDADVDLATLSEEETISLISALEIPLDRQIPFSGLSDIYTLRGPLTKHPDMFVPLCWQIAKDYASMGVSYAELSFAMVVEHDRLRALQQCLPKIEVVTGVRLRFMAAMGRRDDAEWALDMIERIQCVMQCPWIVGVDFLGHEVNSTYAIAPSIRRLADIAHRLRKGFVIRVHAGENPAHPENIRVALESVQNYDVVMRIGHGLYGVDDKTLELLHATQAIVEFNLTSNLSLNNILSCRYLPLKRYLNVGISVVLGTDGYGTYQTDSQQEWIAAQLAGVDNTSLAKIQQAEQEYLARRQHWDGSICTTWESCEIPDDQPLQHYNEAVEQEKQLRQSARQASLHHHFAKRQIPLILPDALPVHVGERRLIVFSGAWKHNWQSFDSAMQQQIEVLIDSILGKLAAEQVMLITGGTRFGVEKIVQAAAKRYAIPVIGATIWKMSHAAISDQLTYAMIVGEELYDKAAGLYQSIRAHNPLCLFIGGGDVVSSEIQVADNLKLNTLLLANCPGASGEHASLKPHRAFHCAEDVLCALHGRNEWLSDQKPYWHLGANPTVDLLAVRHNPDTYQREVLLVQRNARALAEPGKWALPGGFVDTNAPMDAPWLANAESLQQACVRETKEETCLDLQSITDEMVHLADYEGNGRDPRDTPERWSRNSLFVLSVPDDLATIEVEGGDDASFAKWISLDNLPWNLAFDHQMLITDGVDYLDTAE